MANYAIKTFFFILCFFSAIKSYSQGITKKRYSERITHFANDFDILAIGDIRNDTLLVINNDTIRYKVFYYGKKPYKGERVILRIYDATFNKAIYDSRFAQTVRYNRPISPTNSVISIPHIYTHTYNLPDYLERYISFQILDVNGLLLAQRDYAIIFVPK